MTRGAAGAITGDTDGASTFNGSTAAAVDPNAIVGPERRSRQEAWFKTTSTTGGKIVGFGDQPDRRQQQLRPPHLHGRQPARCTSASTTTGSAPRRASNDLQRRAVAPRGRHAGRHRHDAVRRRQEGRSEHRHHRRPRPTPATGGSAATTSTAGPPARAPTSPATSTTSRSTRRASPSTRSASTTRTAAAPWPAAPKPTDAYGKAVYNAGSGLLLAARREPPARSPRTRRPMRRTALYSGGVTLRHCRCGRRDHQHGGHAERQRRSGGVSQPRLQPDGLLRGAVVQDHDRRRAAS